MTSAAIAEQQRAAAARVPRAVVSNGLNRFHLAVAAEEAARADLLDLLLTAGYPTRRALLIANALRLTDKPSVRRLIDRGVDVDEATVTALWSSEVLAQFGTTARLCRLERAAELLEGMALHAYARGAVRAIRRLPRRSGVYHYRSGFGLGSVQVAVESGLAPLCDHSIVHPLALNRLLGRVDGRLSLPWRIVLRDLEAAHHVLVNSEFVRSTFVEAGWPEEKVSVIYLGIDDAFLERISSASAPPPGKTLRVLFAGAFEERKGADTVVDALRSLDDVPWRLEIAGAVMGLDRPRRSFLRDQRVSVLGTVVRSELPTVMARNDLLLFPSRAEGSARVIFETMACGRYVVTTRNAGSIVEDGVHGALVDVGDAPAVCEALRNAWRDRARMHEIGIENAAVVRRSYRQDDYARQLLELYVKVERCS